MTDNDNIKILVTGLPSDITIPMAFHSFRVLFKRIHVKQFWIRKVSYMYQMKPRLKQMIVELKYRAEAHRAQNFLTSKPYVHSDSIKYPLDVQIVQESLESAKDSSEELGRQESNLDQYKPSTSQENNSSRDYDPPHKRHQQEHAPIKARHHQKYSPTRNEYRPRNSRYPPDQSRNPPEQSRYSKYPPSLSRNSGYSTDQSRNSGYSTDQSRNSRYPPDRPRNSGYSTGPSRNSRYTSTSDSSRDSRYPLPPSRNSGSTHLPRNSEYSVPSRHSRYSPVW